MYELSRSLLISYIARFRRHGGVLVLDELKSGDALDPVSERDGPWKTRTS